MISLQKYGLKLLINPNHIVKIEYESYSVEITLTNDKLTYHFDSSDETEEFAFFLYERIQKCLK